MYKLFRLIFIAYLSFAAQGAWAANYSDPIDGVFQGAFGDTITVEVPSMETKSPVSNANQNGNLTFRINPNTAYRNFNELTQLKVGEPVRIEYTQDMTGKIKDLIATSITRLDTNVVYATTPASRITTTVVSPPAGQTVVTTTAHPQ